MERKTRAVFMRGGTSNGVVFRTEDLPEDAVRRDDLLLNVLGSPDPYQRQLNGLGGGVSSLSKALWVARSERNDADIDYTFAQIAVDTPVVDLSANCGNMTTAMGPFAVDEDIFPVDGGEAHLRMYNTNTRKLVHARFQVKDNRAVSEGDLEIPGVPGTGAPVRLEFLEPSGIAGRGVLPSGQAREMIEVAGFGEVPVTICDSAALCVFAPAHVFGLDGGETPDTIDAGAEVMAALETIRREAAVRAGMVASPEDAPLSAPKVAIIAPPTSFTALDAREFEPKDFDIAVRMVSLGRVHRAVPLTGAMCLATAAAIEESLPHGTTAGRGPEGALRIGNPSGIMTAAASAHRADGGWHVENTVAFRTFRRLMEGFVFHP